MTLALVAAELFHGRTIPVSNRVLRAAATATWRLRLQPVDAGWVDLALAAPLMSSDRAERELGWKPTVGAGWALRDLVAGIATRAHTDSAPLSGDKLSPGRPAGLLRGRLPGSGNPY